MRAVVSYWTPARDALLCDLWRTGTTTPNAMAALNALPGRQIINPRDVTHRASIKGIRRSEEFMTKVYHDRAVAANAVHAHPSEHRAEVERLWATGLSAALIGKALNVSKGSVLGLVHRMHLPSRASACVPHAPRQQIAHRSPRITLALGPDLSLPTPFRPLPRCACQFPMWGDGKPTHKYCGAVSVPGRTYCLSHVVVCYRPAPKPAEQQELAA